VERVFSDRTIQCEHGLFLDSLQQRKDRDLIAVLATFGKRGSRRLEILACLQRRQLIAKRHPRRLDLIERVGSYAEQVVGGVGALLGVATPLDPAKSVANGVTKMGIGSDMAVGKLVDGGASILGIGHGLASVKVCGAGGSDLRVALCLARTEGFDRGGAAMVVACTLAPVKH
jgi:hypothetical protein